MQRVSLSRWNGPSASELRFNRAACVSMRANPSSSCRSVLRERCPKLSRAQGLSSLSELSTRTYGGLEPGAAQVAYLQSYGFIDFLARVRGESRLRDLCRRLVRTGDLSASLRRIFRSDLARLEASYFDALRGAAH